MSRCTLYIADKNGDLHTHADFQNAWWGAACVWEQFGRRYLGYGEETCLLLDKKKMRAVWDLADDVNVPFADRVTLATTFDNVLVPSDDFKRLVDCMVETSEWLPSSCHIWAQAAEIGSFIGNPGVLAVGWRQTSVAADSWAVDEDEERSYNLFKDKGHWWLFDEVKP